jgi:hypothetical protein
MMFCLLDWSGYRDGLGAPITGLEGSIFYRSFRKIPRLPLIL